MLANEPDEEPAEPELERAIRFVGLGLGCDKLAEARYANTPDRSPDATDAWLADHLRQALALGYRVFDTAEMYENEAILGSVMAAVPRSELFIMTKLSSNEVRRRNG